MELIEMMSYNGGREDTLDRLASLAPSGTAYRFYSSASSAPPRAELIKKT
jgi:hypothetical protein